jgi:probable F420-dependent oxidoreductase
VKIRIGVGLGAGALEPPQLAEAVDAVVELGLDSIWMSEVLTAPVVDPLVALAWAAAHNPTVKLGTTMVLPGRHPLRLAKELATLDALSGGRLLLTFVPGLTYGKERGALGMMPGARSAAIEELLPLLRRLWAGDAVTYDGADMSLDEVALAPLPAQEPLEAWLGGMAPAALERCGRLADGWLPSLCTPEQAAEGRTVVEGAARGAGRSISPEHFGVSIAYASGPLSEEASRAVAARSRGQRPEDLVPVGVGGLRDLLESFANVGFSKFVVRPLVPPESWRAEIQRLAAGVGDLQT